MTIKRYAIVLDPGTDHEEYYADYDTLPLAQEALEKIIACGDGPADIMRQLEDGSLTTEF
jgi:hypothetical protein